MKTFMKAIRILLSVYLFISISMAGVLLWYAQNGDLEKIFPLIVSIGLSVLIVWFLKRAWEETAE